MLVITIIAARSVSFAQADENRTIAFTHVNVIPMNKEIVLSDYTVIVRNGKIQDMGTFSSVAIPKDATLIEATGKFMIPALSDMHVHLEGDAWNIMYSPQNKYTSSEINFSDILFVYIANGITTIDVLFAFPEHISVRDKIQRNEMAGPRLILSRMIDGAGKAWPPPLGVWINNPAEAKQAVMDAHQQGYDRIKVYSFLDQASYDTILATAKSLNMPVDGHVPFASSVEHVSTSGQKMIAHIEEVMKFAKGDNKEQVKYYSDLLVKRNIWVTSSLVLNKNLNALLKDSAGEFSKQNVQYLHPMGMGIWSYVYQNIYKPIPEKHREYMTHGYNTFQKPFAYEFYRKGGKLLSGTDALVPSTLPGFSLHDELQELVNAGLRPYEALKISTTNVFEFLGELPLRGTIETGKHADLLLLDGNPLEDIANTKKILGVMYQHRWISKTEINRRLEEISKSYATLRKRKNQ